MLKEQKFVLCIVAILGILLATPTPAAALDIEGIYMTSCKDYLDGTAITDPWCFEVWVDFQDPTGDLDYIEVIKPGDPSPFATLNESSDWDYESPDDYSSLGDLRDDYPVGGTYTFKFYTGGGVNIAMRTYPSLSPPDSPVSFNYPIDNSINPTFEWTIASSAGDALGMWLWDPDAGEDVYGQAPVSMDTLSWGPLGPLQPNHDYDLEVSVFKADLVGGELPTGAFGTDTFEYYFLVEYMNETEFTTVPEPATVALLGLGSLVLIRRKRRT